MLVVQVTLAPCGCCTGSVSKCDKRLMRWAQFDAAFEARIQDAANRGCVLRYVAAVDVAAGACSVRLQVSSCRMYFASGLLLEMWGSWHC